MNKQIFLQELEKRINSLPENERNKTLEYYDEMICERMEDGVDEEEAVKDLGDMDVIVKNIMMDMSIPVLIKTRMNEEKKKTKNQLKWPYILLIAIGSPLWISLLIAFISVIFAVYVSIWSVFVALYAVLAALSLSGIAVLISGTAVIFTRDLFAGLTLIGTALIISSIAMFVARPIIEASKYMIKFTCFVARKIKSLFIIRG